MSGERWAVAGERNSYGNPEHLLWPDDQDPDLPHRFTESHFAEAWPNTEDSIVAPAFAALVQAVRDAERLRSSPSDPPLMLVKMTPQLAEDVAWLAKLARGSSWPGEMAERVEQAANRVIREYGPDADDGWGVWAEDDIPATMLRDGGA